MNALIELFQTLSVLFNCLFVTLAFNIANYDMNACKVNVPYLMSLGIIIEVFVSDIKFVS